MEENTQAKSRMEMPPYSKQEQEMDILKEICLGRKLRTEVTESMLCQHFQISKSTLTAALKKMAEKGFIYSYKPNAGISLTPYGVSVGNECLARNYAICQFLQYIGVSVDTAEQDACRAEHVFTDETVKAMDVFVNSDIKEYERVIRKSDLKDRYAPGKYEFMMQIYSMDRIRPRRFSKEHFWYTGDITLEIAEESWFELQYAEESEKFRKKLWYKSVESATDDWKEAERGKMGERIPADAFEYIVKAGESLVEGSLLIALTEEDERPDFWSSCQLEIEIW